MAKLTGLEMATVQDIADNLEVIKKSYDHNVDSIQDFICKQFELTTDEPGVLNACIKHFELTVNKLEVIQNQMDLLVDHFISK